MIGIKRMITEMEADLRAALASRSPPGSPKRFLEIDAFAARIRLKALRDALRALEMAP